MLNIARLKKWTTKAMLPVNWPTQKSWAVMNMDVQKRISALYVNLMYVAL